ncbi:hypothetical protein BDK51DRAFT_26531 [Blyttiomyces helicus]|uniref:TLC domain-containing protein n=1 Tax=Blyttiomyces helicus TaxID=388810 RepID=A0A4P9W7K0_9FUNG|nr:hypothetical protein BDK51DRAFT_26531 [Blyttiomyces helicus]|eukprot:RKO86750.1 hypothetical protein BDK51DRAFT_26531 [Blyttiomyces helicus]
MAFNITSSAQLLLPPKLLPPSTPPSPPLTSVRSLAAPFKGILAPFLLHTLLHKAASTLLPHVLPAATYTALTPTDRLYLAQKLPATAHALLVALPSLHIHLVDQPWRKDLVAPYPAQLDRLFAAHVGFTAYDLALMAVAGGEHWSAWVHHVLGGAGAVASRYFGIGYFPAVFLPTEITVVATNGLWVLQKIGRGGSDAYGRWLWIRAVLFVLFRAPAGAIGLWYALKVCKENPIPSTPPADSASPHKPSPLATLIDQFNRFPGITGYLTAANYFAFTLLNAYWTRLVFTALFRFGKTRGVERSAAY